MLTATVTVRLDEPLGRINPNVYGHFAEHLGRCIDEGTWVGETSAIPNDRGIRKDVVEALKPLQPPVVRWPGGCFADAYDWRDGIGPRDQRPRRINVWWNREEDNQFGTDEFIRFCRAIGAEPYICGNVGSGNPREMMQWLEYCNYEGTTTLAQERAANGHPAPYKVKYWGIGNENWGCGGHYDADHYAREYRRFASYLRRIDPEIQLISCGFNAEWDLAFFNTLKRIDLVDHHSIHHYYKCGPGTGFSEEQYYGLFPAALVMEGQIRRLAQLLGHFERGRQIGIAVDEWGVWHPEADVGLYQPNTLRDALAAALVFDVFHRNAEYVTMANIAQLINVLQCLIQTDGAAMWLTPTYHIYDLYKPHMGNVAVRTDVEVDRHEFTLDNQRQSVALVSASASRNNGSGGVVLSVTNLSLDASAEVTVYLHAGEATSGSMRLLTATQPDAVNSADKPDAVRVVDGGAVRCAEEITVELPPMSAATVTLS
ncbi:MAG: alpha-N-arabinofuranosidase [Armatimonadetes bacterium]|nr:alpha-N-arabinofuranosidase [Armatimonadota bacterium]